MIIKCLDCNKFYDDEFRDISCPHATFLANDGQNNFRHYPQSWLSADEPTHEEYLNYKMPKVRI